MALPAVRPRSFAVGRIAETFREIARRAAPGNGRDVPGDSRCDYRATLVAGPRSVFGWEKDLMPPKAGADGK
jgi:hypothetical protein